MGSQEGIFTGLDGGTRPRGRAEPTSPFDLLLELLDRDTRRAAEEYELLRRKLVRFFRSRNCRDAEAQADEVIERITRRIGEGAAEEIDDVRAYAYGTARILHLEILRERNREQRALGELGRRALQVEAAEEETAYEHLFRRFESCLGELPRESESLILEYYKDDGRARAERRRTMAARLGVSAVALRIRARRIRARLERCIARCGEESSAR